MVVDLQEMARRMLAERIGHASQPRLDLGDVDREPSRIRGAIVKPGVETPGKSQKCKAK